MASATRFEDDKGKHTHTAWLYQGDSGTIFKADSTTVAAEVVQGFLECDNSKLNIALQLALATFL